MKYENAIFICIEYIEENIKEYLTIETIAKKVGYSAYHFSRIFKMQMGTSLMEYVNERRLICASKEIFAGKKIIDVSIEYGYNTHSGFSKAFKKRFGFTPTLIHAIRMSFSLLNKKGGIDFLTDNSIKEIGATELEESNLFVKPSLNFTSPDILYIDLVASIQKNHLFDDLTMVEKAYRLASNAHAGQYRRSGDPFIVHPICVATILAEMESDEESIIAGLLHDVLGEDTVITLPQIVAEFSDVIGKLVADVTQFTEITWDEKIKDVSILDSRVILIKLADRLHNMRTIKYIEPEKWKQKAKETIEIFSPMAARLGISKIKTELDDLSLMNL